MSAAISLGSHVQRIGISFNSYYYYHFVQLNAAVRLYRNLKNLGPIKEYNEAVGSVGIVLAVGKKQHYFNSFVSAYSNQTGKKYSLAYTYNAYFNRIKTSQQTGIVALQFDQISIITENDILAKPVLDRFRTGAFLLQYQYRNTYQAAINCTMWTGKMGAQIKGNSNFPSGYMDTTGAVYSNCSHGLLSAQLKINLGYAQHVQLNAGIDAEQVRNAVQNKLIHDMVFLPRKWYSPVNSYIPMIDSNGKQYLYQPGQKIRSPKPYWNVAAGSSAFY